MARTIEDLLFRVGEILQDEAHVRYTQDQIYAHYWDAVEELKSIRPDLSIGLYGTALPPIGEPKQTPTVFPDQFFASVCNYIAGACELRDDEFAVDGRAMTLRQMLAKKLVSGM